MNSTIVLFQSNYKFDTLGVNDFMVEGYSKET